MPLGSLTMSHTRLLLGGFSDPVLRSSESAPSSVKLLTHFALDKKLLFSWRGIPDPSSAQTPAAM